MDLTDDFNVEFLNKYSDADYDDINNGILSLLEKGNNSVKIVNKWELGSSIEKHDALNHTYHIDITNEDIEDINISLSFYTGINVGCELVHYDFYGSSPSSTPLFQDVLKDIEPDWDRYNLFFKKGYNKNRIEMVFNSHKEEIIQLINKQSYDDYVTGGGNNKINEYYAEKFSELSDRNIFFRPVYEKVEVERNFI